jgi:hypothetical protein
VAMLHVVAIRLALGAGHAQTLPVHSAKEWHRRREEMAPPPR